MKYDNMFINFSTNLLTKRSSKAKALVSKAGPKSLENPYMTK